MSAHDRGHDHLNDELADKIGELWNRQENIMLTDPTALTDSLKRRQKQEQRRLFRLNVQEIVPAAASTALFTGFGMAADRGAWAYFAAAVCAGVGLFLFGSTVRQRRVESRFDHSVRGELERSLSQLRHRAWLYRNIMWWYLGPLIVAILLVIGAALPADSGAGGAAFAVLYLAGLAALCRHLYRSNRRIASERYEPEVERHQRLLEELDRA